MHVRAHTHTEAHSAKSRIPLRDFSIKLEQTGTPPHRSVRETAARKGCLQVGSPRRAAGLGPRIVGREKSRAASRAPLMARPNVGTHVGRSCGWPITPRACRQLRPQPPLGVPAQPLGGKRTWERLGFRIFIPMMALHHTDCLVQRPCAEQTVWGETWVCTRICSPLFKQEMLPASLRS